MRSRGHDLKEFVLKLKTSHPLFHLCVHAVVLAVLGVHVVVLAPQFVFGGRAAVVRVCAPTAAVHAREDEEGDGEDG